MSGFCQWHIELYEWYTEWYIYVRQELYSQRRRFP